LRLLCGRYRQNSNGTISSQAHNGRQATLINQVRLFNGGTTYAGGTCRVVARTVYWGTELVGEQEVTLAP